MNDPELNVGPRLARTDVTPVGAISSFLIREGLMTRADVENVAAKQREENISFVEAIRRMRLIDDGVLREAVAHQFGFLMPDRGLGGLSSELVTAFNPESRNADALRSLRTQLSVQGLGEKFKLVSILGGSAGAGATYVAANLGVLYAQLGARTVIVDADLRNPRQHDVFGLGEGIGLADWIIDSAGPHSVRQVRSIPNLHVLRSGTLPPNPQEILSRKSFRLVCDMLALRHDVVIVDAAPTHLNSDAMTVSLVTQYCALVARQNSTHLWEMRGLSEQLKAAGIRIAGSVLNRF